MGSSYHPTIEHEDRRMHVRYVSCTLGEGRYARGDRAVAGSRPTRGRGVEPTGTAVVSSLLAPSVVRAIGWTGGGSGRELAESIFINCYNRIYAVPRATGPVVAKWASAWPSLPLCALACAWPAAVRLASSAARSSTHALSSHVSSPSHCATHTHTHTTHAHAHAHTPRTVQPRSIHRRATHATSRSSVAQNKPSSSTPSWRLRSRRRMLPWASR